MAVRRGAASISFSICKSLNIYFHFINSNIIWYGLHTSINNSILLFSLFIFFFYFIYITDII